MLNAESFSSFKICGPTNNWTEGQTTPAEGQYVLCEGSSKSRPHEAIHDPSIARPLHSLAGSNWWKQGHEAVRPTQLTCAGVSLSITNKCKASPELNQLSINDAATQAWWACLNGHQWFIAHRDR